jgi:hypothetical protein
VKTVPLGAFGKRQGFETVKAEDGTILAVNPNTSESNVLYNPNSPNGGFPEGGLMSIIPDGTYLQRGQCGEFVNDLTGLGVGETFASKMAKMDSSITKDTAQVGDVVTIAAGSTGHIGIINRVDRLPDGTVKFQLSESNWVQPNTVSHTRQVDASQVSGFARPGFVKQALGFGTDAAGNNMVTDLARQYASATSPTERNQVLTQAKTLNIKPDAIVRESMTIPAPNGVIVDQVTGRVTDKVNQATRDAITDLKTISDQMQQLSSIMDESPGLYKAVKKIGGLNVVTSALGGFNTGPVTGRLNQLAAEFGIGSQDVQNFLSILANTNSLLIKERSGSAVTPQEFERLSDALPQITKTEGFNRTAIRNMSNSALSKRAETLRLLGADIKGEQIEVIDKKTGERGTIPAYEFDQNLYQISF